MVLIHRPSGSSPDTLPLRQPAMIDNKKICVYKALINNILTIIKIILFYFLFIGGSGIFVLAIQK